MEYPILSYDDYRQRSAFSEAILERKARDLFESTFSRRHGLEHLARLHVLGYDRERETEYEIWILRIDDSTFRYYNTEQEARGWEMLYGRN